MLSVEIIEQHFKNKIFVIYLMVHATKPFWKISTNHDIFSHRHYKKFV